MGVISMKALSPEVSALLDKLYNLRGEDSVILVDMYKQKHKAEETKERTTEEKKELQEKIADLEQLNEALNDQGDKLVSVLSGIDRSEYAIVLDRLKIDFNPHALVEKINKSLPRTIDSVTLETKKAAEKLLKVEDEMNTAITTIDELAIRRDAALANQAKLNEYFELALTGSINITRDSITTLLAQFGFSEADQRSR
jgi:phage shock protein A